MIVTTQQVIVGLYIAFFSRAPDEAGLNFWENRALGATPQAVVKELAAGFASHYKFAELYDPMGNQAFVEAIYINVLGASGDAGGISFWTSQINGGVSRSDMVSTFIYSALSFNQNDAQWDSLSMADKAVAQSRQDTLKNKIEAGLYFTDKYGEASNITAPNDLDNDLAYVKSIAVLQDIDHSSESVINAKLLVDNNIIHLSAVDPLFHQGTDGITDTFIYEIDSSNYIVESRETGDMSLQGFNIAEDKLIFEDVATGTTSTALFSDDALISSNTDTQINFEVAVINNDDIVIAEQGFSLTLVGITDFSTIDYSVA